MAAECAPDVRDIPTSRTAARMLQHVPAVHEPLTLGRPWQATRPLLHSTHRRQHEPLNDQERVATLAGNHRRQRGQRDPRDTVARPVPLGRGSRRRTRCADDSRGAYGVPAEVTASRGPAPARTAGFGMPPGVAHSLLGVPVLRTWGTRAWFRRPMVIFAL